MKSYTDKEQSKKLAEILPIESADMLWEQHGAEPYVTIKPWTTIGKTIGCHCLSCWSLAALFNLCPTINGKQPILTRGKLTGLWYCYYEDELDTQTYDNPVDACYEMIIKLNEHKML